MEHSSSGSRTTIRRWVRSDEPQEGWWPWGLIPLIGLLALALIAFLYVAPKNVEAETQSEAQRQLNRAGLGWATATADGQKLRVTGTAPGAVTSELREQVTRAASVGNCEVFGCEVIVELRAGTAPATTPTPMAKPAVAERFHDFTFVATGDSIVLEGEVESEDVRRQLVAAAKKHFEKVEDKLTISTENATKGYPLAYRRALPILAMLESGRATWTNGMFDVTGLVSQANDAPAREAFTVADKSLKLGKINLIVKEAADRCDQEFAAALAAVAINFRTSSAIIAPSSRPVLAKLAETAKACAGTLAIEGHTDSDGKEDSNMALSRSRAEAVAQALGALGIEDDRLAPKGFGESKPIAPNTTPVGKAKNRRIEVRVVR